MKKKAALLLAAVITLSACGNSGNSGNTTETDTIVTTEILETEEVNESHMVLIPIGKILVPIFI